MWKKLVLGGLVEKIEWNGEIEIKWSANEELHLNSLIDCFDMYYSFFFSFFFLENMEKPPLSLSITHKIFNHRKEPNLQFFVQKTMTLSLCDCVSDIYYRSSIAKLFVYLYISIYGIIDFF